MKTETKKMTQMPQQYCLNLKGMGWVHVVDAEADAEEVNKVWEMQKKALLDSTILGKHTWSGCRLSRTLYFSVFNFPL